MDDENDWVWSLKGVSQVNPEEKHVRHIRIFDPAQAASERVAVRHYKTLDMHPQLILFEGWMNKKTETYEIKEVKGVITGTKAA